AEQPPLSPPAPAQRQARPHRRRSLRVGGRGGRLRRAGDQLVGRRLRLRLIGRPPTFGQHHEGRRRLPSPPDASDDLEFIPPKIPPSWREGRSASGTGSQTSPPKNCS